MKQPTSADHVARADDLLALERYDLALAEVQAALALDPNNAEAHVSGAWILRAQKRYADAEVAARAALAADPHLAGAHNILACVLWSWGRFKEAEAAFRIMLTATPDHNEALFRTNYARLLIDLNRAPAGLAMAESALGRLPHLAVGHEVRGTALVALDRAAEAALAYRRTLEIDPRNFNALYRLGRLELRAGHSAAALDLFRDALRLRPAHDEARAGLVTALKARQPIYGWLLGLFLRHQRHGNRALGLVLVVVFCTPALISIVLGADSALGSLLKDVWQWLVAALMLGGLGFAYGKRVTDPIFNTLLLLDPLGRQIIDPEPTDAVRVGAIVVTLGSLLLGLALGVGLGFKSALCGAALSLCAIGVLASLWAPNVKETGPRLRWILWTSYGAGLAAVYGLALALILKWDALLVGAVAVFDCAVPVFIGALIARGLARRRAR
ncbi:MAG: tetratricopeptide repeat protein [Chloroflexota bacterium]|nr:tetratricopeptide repeat protein [Chloroflexota bacterium]